MHSSTMRIELDAKFKWHIFNEIESVVLVVNFTYDRGDAYTCTCTYLEWLLGFISVGIITIRIPDSALNSSGFRNPDNSDLSGLLSIHTACII